MRTQAQPPRVAKRPDPSSWDLDELMTLEEAAVLHWPDGPLTARSLRTAAEGGALGTVIVARKRLTTRRQIVEMSRCDRGEARIAKERPTLRTTRTSHKMTAAEARAYMTGRSVDD